jgi:uncharacterized protein with PIN domain
MRGRAVYLDTSAFVKLIVTEPESEAPRTRLARWPDRASCTMLRTEAVAPRSLRKWTPRWRVSSASRWNAPCPDERTTSR